MMRLPKRLARQSRHPLTGILRSERIRKSDFLRYNRLRRTRGLFFDFRSIFATMGIVIDYQKELNAQQYAAVMHENGPALIVAGAGTGKTRTLVYRVARLVESGVHPKQVLLLTFTRRAANEMLLRVSRLLQNDTVARRAEGGTFHAFANMALRRFGKHVALPKNFSIIDRSDQEDVIQHLRLELGLAQRGRRFPQKSTIAEVFSKSANTMTSVETILEWQYPQFAHEEEALRKLHEVYFAWKKDHALCDYDDLLLNLLALLEREERVRDAVSGEIAHILVDEYQDTNRLQSEILRHLGMRHHHIVAVGDDAQSIYSFRGASFRNIMDFPKDFPGARIITLEQNYRSTQPILEAANAVIGQAKEKYDKQLFSEKPSQVHPMLIACADEPEQSAFVADRILELRESGVPLEDIAVLFRSSFHSFDLETELSRRALPFVKYGGFKFMETAHVKDAIAHLRLFLNPSDVVSAQRILLLLEGVGAVHARMLARAIEQRRSVVEGLGTAKIPPRIKETLAPLADLMGRLPRSVSPSRQVGEVASYLRPLVELKYADDFSKRLRDLEHLVAIADRFKTTDRFLEHLALEPPEVSLAAGEGVENDERPLVLSTIHSAKGLEWHTVFVIWTLDGFFPADYSFMSEEDLEEERRLFYVAMTRAKEQLYLTYPTEVSFSRGPAAFARPSRFLEGVSRKTLPLIYASGLLSSRFAE